MQVLITIVPGLEDVLPDVGHHLGVKDSAVDIAVAGVANVVCP